MTHEELLIEKREAHRLLLCNQARNPVRGEERWLAGYSDASFFDHTMQGGWGVWVRDDQTRVLASGPTPDWVRNSAGAELVAVTNAIHTALEHLDSDKANIMVIKTDCQTVARWFGWGGGGLPRVQDRKGDERAAHWIRTIREALEHCDRRGVKLVVTWVKGHNGTRDTKSYLNTQVDRMAGKANRTQKGEFFKHAVNKG